MIKCVALNTLFLISVLFSSFSVNAQYYYKDILANLQLNNEFLILKTQQIKTINLKSFEDNDEPSEGFFCEKKINKNYSQSEMISKSYITGQSLLVTDYNQDGRVITTTNNTTTTTNVVRYEYNNQGKISLINTITRGEGDSTGITETHEYIYDSNGNLQKMLRKKNNLLLSTITFIMDDKGNIIEEDAAGKGNDKKYYYYYDEQNRLTDVVHFNERAQRLLPDYMFEYNQVNLIKQMISIDETASNYFIWKYSYNDKRLPEIQKCYSKEKRLLGTIQYEYE
ncbi:MAG: hypothetical protein M3Z26_07020 [Bacteroidota bacterium]|nr:hypothetical protein [Bacteroidota bacterium]